MADLRKILLANYKNGNADRIKSRWCSGDSPGLFKERWEKLFEDWVVSPSAEPLFLYSWTILRLTRSPSFDTPFAGCEAGEV